MYAELHFGEDTDATRRGQLREGQLILVRIQQNLVHRNSSTVKASATKNLTVGVAAAEGQISS